MMTGCKYFSNNKKNTNSGRKIVKEYYSNGKIKSINQVIDDKRDGLCKYYNEKGILIATTEFQNNKYNGKYTTYYANGKKRSEVMYQDHIRNGKAFIYYEDGTLSIEETYKDNELNGEKKKYYANGKLRMENEYKNGKPSINLKEYDPYGKLKSHYPKIQIENIDHVLLERKYILKVSFSDKSRTAVFYMGDLDENKFLPPYLPEHKTSDGVASIEFYVPPGSILMKTITIIGAKRTQDGNTYVTTKKYNLAVKG